MCHFLSGGSAAHTAPYVSISLEEQRGVCSSICVNFYQGVAAAAMRPICVNFSSRSGVQSDPYASNFSRGAALSAAYTTPYVSISLEEQRGVCSSICVKLLSGGSATHAAPYASIFYQEAPRRMQLHMRRISIRERRDAYSFHMCQFFCRGATPLKSNTVKNF